MLEVTHLDTKPNPDLLEVDLPNLQRRIDTQVAILQEAFQRLRTLQPLSQELEPEPAEEILRYAI